MHSVLKQFHSIRKQRFYFSLSHITYVYVIPNTYFVKGQLIHNFSKTYLCIREEVGQNQKQSDKQSHPSWNYFRINQKTDSSYKYQYSTCYMIFHYECHWISRQFKFNAKDSWHVGRFSRCCFSLAVPSWVYFNPLYSIILNYCLILSPFKLGEFIDFCEF